ncbi:hypothetical protein BKK47_02635 [Rodentibacter mrazii]|uniref:DUF4054 domain-containing protein n=1 Tax=Rodentibacter mrazii TaxID=1908257 RepID=A0A1V3IIV2_9PAST|nr:DUF4054 domain-containing protein [Rodentibacter mrazii]OOF40944.1 hypothetical protein BKK47_02635 [Rodentibacter mrazii]
MPLQEEFLQRYPEFNQTDINLVGLFIDDAQSEISQKRWGKLYQRGVMALTAHLLRLRLDTSENQGNAHHNLAGESAGELSVSYAVPTMDGSDQYYQLTAYGQEYLRLRKLVGIGVMVA